MSRLLFWVRVTRPFSFPASVMGILIGVAAVAPINEWRWGLLAAMLAFVILLHCFGNLLNDYFDFTSGVDKRVEGDADRPGRFLVRGEIRPGQVRNFALVCLALAALPGFVLLREGGWFSATLGIGGVLGAFLYTAPPFQLKHRGLGELWMLIFFGPAEVAGAAWIQSGTIPLDALLISLPVGLSVSAICSAGNLRDIDEDAAANIDTLAVMLGRKTYSVLYIGLLIALPTLVTVLCATGAASRWTLLGWLSFPIALPLIASARRGWRQSNGDAMTAGYMTAFCALVLIGLVISGAKR